jgi:hypothetical protein
MNRLYFHLSRAVEGHWLPGWSGATTGSSLGIEQLSTPVLVSDLKSIIGMGAGTLERNAVPVPAVNFCLLV